MSDPVMATPRAAVRTKISQAAAWALPVLRVFLVAGAAFLVWYVAGHWNRWTGAARYESTDDAYTFGDLTPLSAKVSGYVETVAVNDFQSVHRGDLIVQIEPSDYLAALEQAEAGLAAAQAVLANLGNQKDIQRALIRQAEATIQSTTADLERYSLEGKRQRELVTKFAGTQQLLEQADDNEKRTAAQLQLNGAQLDQQKALLASLDVQEKQLAAQVKGAEAQV